MIRVSALRMYRLVAILLAAWMLQFADRRSVDLESRFALSDVKLFFPEAQTISPPDDRNFCAIWNSHGVRLGSVLATSPESDEIIGYSGASNLMAAIDAQGHVIGVKVLASGDTPAHVRDVDRHNTFWRQLVGWSPDIEPLPRIDAVSGSTLTSLAMAEAVETRLRGQSSSKRFPLSITLDEVHAFFPAAAELREESERPSWHKVTDASGKLLGYVVRTAPASDNVRGYKGPTESLIAVASDRQTILGVRLRSSFDTPDYVDRVRDDTDFLALLAKHRVSDWPQIDFRKAGIEGVSGATNTSFAVAEGIRRRFRADLEVPPVSSKSVFTIRNICVSIIAIGGLAISLTRLRSSRQFLRVWHIVVVVMLGLWFGDLLSLATFAGWGRSGVPFQTSPGIVLLAAVALLTPWSTRRNVYCQHICPHGIVQGWLGRFRRCHIGMPDRVRSWLGRIPVALLITGCAIAVAIPRFDLTMLEPFDAWVLKGAALVSAVIAVTGLLTSIFVPQAYCRFGCPTGALLKFVRSGGEHDRFGLRDAIPGLLILVVGTIVGAAKLQVPVLQSTPDVASAPAISGRAFGTTWSVMFRSHDIDVDRLRDETTSEVNRIEALLSHWSKGSATADFNANETTLEMEVPPELIQLVIQSQELSRATDGAYDITIAPLVNAWGFGPSGEIKSSPTDDELALLLAKVGWQKLSVDRDANTLKKGHPELQIDLGSILQGYTADRIAAVIRESMPGDEPDYLIDVGGELLAKGSWSVAIEDPANPSKPKKTLELTNAALATSGTSRATRIVDGQPIHHLISPKTGRPIPVRARSTSVRARTCLEADGWATALWLVGPDEARRIAQNHQLDFWNFED